MSKTLNFVRVLLGQAQHCHDIGLKREAKVRFERLAAYRSLPADVAEETQVRLSELCQGDDDSFAERRHLARALAQKPNNAEYHFRMATSYLADDGAPDEKALPHLRAAVRIEPDNPAYLAALGKQLVRTEDKYEGLRLLKNAYDRASDNIHVLEQYAGALRDTGDVHAARDLLKAAIFRNCRDARFRDLYRDFQFRDIADEQRAMASISDEPVILRFTGVQKRRFKSNNQILRIDGAEPLTGPSRRSCAGTLR